MLLRGFRRRTGRPAPELAGLFRSIITESRGVHPIASDFLDHFGDGDSEWLNDHWDARINASIGTELFYVSRMSLLRSQGSFVLTRSGTEVRVAGTAGPRRPGSRRGPRWTARTRSSAASATTTCSPTPTGTSTPDGGGSPPPRP